MMVVVVVQRVGIVLLAISSILVTKSLALPVRREVRYWSIRGSTPVNHDQGERPGDEPHALASAFQNGDDVTASNLLMKCEDLDLLEEGIRLFSKGGHPSEESADQGSGPDIVALALATAAMKSGDVQKYSKLAARLARQKGGDLNLLESDFYDAFMDKGLLKRIICFGQGVTNRRMLMGNGNQKKKRVERQQKRDDEKNRKKKEEEGEKEGEKEGEGELKRLEDFEFQCAGCQPIYNHAPCSFCLPSEECKSRAWCKPQKN